RLGLARHELAALDVGWRISRARRRAAEMGQDHKAADHEDKRRHDEPGQPRQRPVVPLEHVRARQPKEERVDRERREEQRNFREDGADHGGIISRLTWRYFKSDTPAPKDSAKSRRWRPRCSARRRAWRSTCA